MAVDDGITTVTLVTVFYTKVAPTVRVTVVTTGFPVNGRSISELCEIASQGSVRTIAVSVAAKIVVLTSGLTDDRWIVGC